MDSLQTELGRGLASRVERDGPITFRDFMEAALYDERLGYYNTERLKIGPEGDYYTASNVHPAFGAALARAFFDLWQGPLSEARDGPLTIVEIGAGTGQLACDILSAMRDERPAAFENLSYIIVEASPAMRARQQEKLAPLAGLVRWQGIQELEKQPLIAIAFSNELVDAMPVHRVRSAGGCIQEQYVGLEQGSDGGAKRLSLFWAAPATEGISDYMDRMKISPAEGQVIEVNLDAIKWVGRMAGAIRRGFLVTIDYGEEAARLYAPDRAGGTLRSFRRHRLIDSPLEAVGEQDMTASVNFTALIEYGRDFGFETVSYERQAAFLIRNGLIDRMSALHGDGGAVDDLKERLAIKNLFVPGGISDNFRVLIQKKS